MKKNGVKQVFLNIRMDPDLKERFVKTCKQNDLDTSKVVRALVKGYVEQSYTPDLFDPSLIEKAKDELSQ